MANILLSNEPSLGIYIQGTTGYAFGSACGAGVEFTGTTEPDLEFDMSKVKLLDPEV